MGDGINVMTKQDVDAVNAQARKGVLHRPHHPVIGIIKHHFAGRGVDVMGLGRAVFGRTDFQQTAYFGREQKRRVAVIAQERVETCFGQTETVKRRGIKKAATGGPSRVQCFAGEAVIKRRV